MTSVESRGCTVYLAFDVPAASRTHCFAEAELTDERKANGPLTGVSHRNMTRVAMCGE
jgi:hypothetical protein